MNKCIFIEENTVNLSSNLDETGFGRSDSGRLISQKGISALITDLTIETADWSFEKTSVKNSGLVAFSGTWNYCKNALTLTEALNLDNKKAACAVLKVITKVLEETDFSSPDHFVLPGAGGILISETDHGYAVLMVPGLLFEQCLSGTADYPEQQGKYVHKGLEGLEAALFTRAVIAYKTITKKLPFNETKLEDRQADITDSNFIPLELAAKGISKELAQAVESGLEVKREKRIIPGERRFVNEKETQERKQLREKALSLQINDIEAFTPEAEDEAFSKQRESFISKKNKIVKISRIYRRNSKRIWTVAAAVVIGIYAVLSFNKENQKLATSLGLTSKETTETLYTGIHHADVTIIQEIAKGKNTRSLIQKVSGFYVTNKQRLALDEKEGTLTPAQWLFFKGTTNFWQYGITDLTIDGESVSTDFSYPRRKDNRSPLKKENGKQLKKGDETTHEASYNLVHYDTDSIIAVNKVTETVTLRWNGKRWIVRSIKGKAKSLSFRTKDYKADYIQALEQTNDSIKEACTLLRQKYSFVPTELDLTSAVPYMIEKYNLSAAKEFN